jgi:hypothetical protein
MEILIDCAQDNELGFTIIKAFNNGASKIIIRKCADCETFLVIEDPTPDEDGEVYCRNC